jgi:hypothetical protein
MIQGHRGYLGYHRRIGRGSKQRKHVQETWLHVIRKCTTSDNAIRSSRKFNRCILCLREISYYQSQSCNSPQAPHTDTPTTSDRNNILKFPIPTTIFPRAHFTFLNASDIRAFCESTPILVQSACSGQTLGNWV